MVDARRVVITGIGVLAPNGIGVEDFWSALLEGRSGIGPISLFDASEHFVGIAGEVDGFDPLIHIPFPVKPKRMGRHTQFALAASCMAIKDARVGESADLQSGSLLPIYVGVSTSAIEVIEQGKEQMSRRGPNKVSPHIVGACQPHAVATAISEHMGLNTRAMTVSTACAAGMDALAEAASVVREGRSDLVLAGGVDAPINPLTVACFGRTRMVPGGVVNAATRSCPFDRRREGGVMAEGGAFFVVESLVHAMARGAEPRLELLGWGSRLDRSAEAVGSGFEDAMREALDAAGTAPRDVHYICAHGPSDPELDQRETEAIKAVYGPWAYRIPVSSIKGVTGNPLAAAGPLELAACAGVFRDDLVPPTANYREPDPACDLDYVPLRPRRYRADCAMLNVHGMGGINSSLVVSRVTRP
ncbi:beta-ketoacyl-[acyl-carrier-protein] synthase family protein [Kiritimatiella glycovorans]|uniref:beta-ketoacyl-[acyl-carrier-protein] synthase family protein n=1 Tax=Kiritimatiella glycovorans TaxID=1307763 RepID=UPI000699AFDF|nr:beta-ketoacyl-[acyl-carrier-protein] synthase family protein [Kiritimatiella glycovorans]